MIIAHEKFLVIDVETTGLDTAADRVVQLGLAVFEDGKCLNRGSVLFNPGIPIPEAAREVHGVDDRRVARCPPFANFVDRLRVHVDSAPLIVGFNCLNFDVPLIDNELARADADWRLPVSKILDVRPFVDWQHRDHRHRTLEAVCGHYALKPVGGKAHAADVDVQMTGELLLSMCQRGLVSADSATALTESLRLKAVVDAEFGQWSYWVYRDRKTQRLRLGAGKHCGQLLADVPKAYLGYLLTNITDLGDETRRVFENARAGRVKNELQRPLLETRDEAADVEWGGW